MSSGSRPAIGYNGLGNRCHGLGLRPARAWHLSVLCRMLGPFFRLIRLGDGDTIERALALTREGIVTKDEIQLRAPSDRSVRWTDQVPLEIGWQANLSELEKSLVERALRQAQGNKSKAAELLGIHRRLLYEKMREFGIEQ